MNSKNAPQFQPPIINNVNDIRRVLANLDPASKLNLASSEVPLSAELIGSDGRNNCVFRVNANTLTRSYRQLIIDALLIIRRREDAAAAAATVAEKSPPGIEINGRRMVPPPVIAADSKLYVDTVIERLLGARREGIFICWNLADGYTYYYEIFEHKLTRAPTHDQSSNDSTG